MVKRIAWFVTALAMGGLAALLLILAIRRQWVWAYLVYLAVLPLPFVCFFAALGDEDTGSSDRNSDHHSDGGVGLGL